jgi:predicted alpha/beta superfamily hydrolase
LGFGPEQSSDGVIEQPPQAEQSCLDPRLQLRPHFKSRFLPDQRDLIVYLPPCYDENPDRFYPVLYMHDGQNLFDGRTSFVKDRTWLMREHTDAAIAAREIQPLVIVGIYNTGDRRIAEYTPDRNAQLGGGEAEAYGRLIIEELMPWVQAEYRVRQDRESTGMAGSSLGGLVTLYLGIRYARYFGKLGALSPSVWWNRKSILGFVNEHAPQIWDRPRLWLDVGDKEGARTMRDAEQLARRLKANGWRPGQTLHFEKVQGGTHDEASWATRVRPMLRFLFPC